MTMRTSPTVEYAFDTRITTLATNVTLSGSTLHEYSPITVSIPETASRRFLSAHLEYTIRDSFTTAVDVDGWRMGFSTWSGSAGWNMVKISGADFTAGASSQTFSGDGWAEMRCPYDPSFQRYFILSDTDPDATNGTNGKYVMYLTAGTLVVYESGSTKFTSTAVFYVHGDLLKIKRVGTTVTYLKNDVVFYTSLVSSTGPLLIDTLIRTTGDIYGIDNIRLFDNGTEVPIIWNNVTNCTVTNTNWYYTDVVTIRANSGDHHVDKISSDVTNIMNEYCRSSTTFSMRSAIAVNTSSASFVNNITCKLLLTYEFDDSTESTLLKTIRIPIHSNHYFLPTSHEEVGLQSGGANNAPSQQIPALDTFLPETGKVFTNSFLELWSNESPGATATDFTPYYKIDAGSEVARATCEQALATNLWWHDIIPYSTATYTTASGHTLSMRNDLATRMCNLGGFLVVTYKYNASSTTLMAEAMIPIEVADFDRIASEAGNAGPTDAGLGDASIGDWMGCDIIISEPGPITIAQSCIFMLIDGSSNGGSPTITAGSQTPRLYESGQNTSGQVPTVHRTDHGNGWTLDRGKNRLVMKIWTGNVSSYYRTGFRGYAVINYTCGRPASGPTAVSSPRSFFICRNKGGGSSIREAPPSSTTHGEVMTPVINGNYRIHGTLIDSYYIGVPTNVQQYARAKPGEFDGGGWVSTPLTTQVAPSERFTKLFYQGNTNWWNIDSNQTGRMDIETSRAWRFYSNQAVEMGALLWASWHNVTFAVSGTWSNYTGSGYGIDVFVYDSDDRTLVASGTTTSGGYYYTTVYYNSTPHFVEAQQDSTHVGRTALGYPVEV